MTQWQDIKYCPFLLAAKSIIDSQLLNPRQDPKCKHLLDACKCIGQDCAAWGETFRKCTLSAWPT